MDIPEPARAISADALASFRSASSAVIDETVKRALKREDVSRHHGDGAGRVLRAGLEFTARMLDVTMSTGEPLLLEDQLSWAKDRLPHDGVRMAHVLEVFLIYRDVISEMLPERHAGEIGHYIDWMIARQRDLALADRP